MDIQTTSAKNMSTRYGCYGKRGQLRVHVFLSGIPLLREEMETRKRGEREMLGNEVHGVVVVGFNKTNCQWGRCVRWSEWSP